MSDQYKEWKDKTTNLLSSSVFFICPTLWAPYIIAEMSKTTGEADVTQLKGDKKEIVTLNKTGDFSGSEHFCKIMDNKVKGQEDKWQVL